MSKGTRIRLRPAPVLDLREAVDEDAPALIELIANTYAEYPGCVLDLPGVDRDLTRVRSTLSAQGGRLWVLPGRAGISACVGYAPHSADPFGAIELKRMYVAEHARGQGLGGALVEWILAVAGLLGVPTVDLWSDSRFHDGHRMYERFDFLRDGYVRTLNDPSDTEELHFVREVPEHAPDATVVWDGEVGIQDRAELRAGAAGATLRGTVDGLDKRVAYLVTTDEFWRPRQVVVAVDDAPSLRLSSDGLGEWWNDGRPVPELAGVRDVDFEFSPATKSIPIRRAIQRGRASVDVDTAMIDWASLQFERVQQRYVQEAERRWAFRSDSWTGQLEVDGQGLVRRYGGDEFVAR